MNLACCDLVLYYCDMTKYHQLESEEARVLEDDPNNLLFVSRPCELDYAKCDACDLQSVCEFEFENGNTCPIIDHNQVWLRLDNLPVESVTRLIFNLE